MGRDEKRKMVDRTENYIKNLEVIGNPVGYVHQQITEEKIIVKQATGGRLIVGCRPKIDREKLKPGTRVFLDMQTHTIMGTLPREVDPSVHNMAAEDPGSVKFSDVGGLTSQIRDLREAIELPLTNPELFGRVGIKPPKGVLLYGPPGTGKTLLARVLANEIDSKFLKVVASSIVDKYIGESARMIREMFAYAKDNQPCIIFLDEVDAIGGKRMNDGSSADREIQRTLMELLNQLDGFEDLGRVKCVMATNRPDVLDPALLRPGRLDRKIEIPLPTETGRLDILRIHCKNIQKHGDIGTEAGMFAIRAERDYAIHEDFMRAARKIKETKKLESKLDYSKV